MLTNWTRYGENLHRPFGGGCCWRIIWHETGSAQLVVKLRRSNDRGWHHIPLDRVRPVKGEPRTCVEHRLAIRARLYEGSPDRLARFVACHEAQFASMAGRAQPPKTPNFTLSELLLA